MLGGIGTFEGPVAGGRRWIGCDERRASMGRGAGSGRRFVFVIAIVFVKSAGRPDRGEKGLKHGQGNGDRGAAAHDEPSALSAERCLMGARSQPGSGSWVIRPKWRAPRDLSRSAIPPISPRRSATPATPTPTVAKMLVKDINNAGGILGPATRVFIEDTAVQRVGSRSLIRKLIQRDKVDVCLAASPARCASAIKDVIVARGEDALHLSAALRGRECTPISFALARRPAQQCDESSPADEERRQRSRCPPRTMLAAPTERIRPQGDEREWRRVIFEEYYPLDQVEYSATVNNKSWTNKWTWSSTPSIPPVWGHLQAALRGRLREARRRAVLLTTMRTPQHQCPITRSRDWRAA